MNFARIVRGIVPPIFLMTVSASCERQLSTQGRSQRLTETTESPAGTSSPNPTAAPSVLILTETPTPTLLPDQIRQEILSLYSDNGGCELPCFWGIIPGKTTLQEINAHFSILGDFRDDTRAKDKRNNFTVTLARVPAPPEIDAFPEIDPFYRGSWTFRIVSQNGVVEGITTSSTYMKRTSVPTISNMLSIFGKPEEIWIAITPFVLNHDVDTVYRIALFYPSKGILIMGSGVAPILSATEKGVYLSICPQRITKTIDMDEHYPFSFHLWSPENRLTFTELTDTQLFGHELYSLFDDLESSMNSEEFYETYMVPSATRCFELTQ